MKKEINSILINLLRFKSFKNNCLKRGLINAISVADIKHVILEGYWQADRMSTVSKSEVDFQYFEVYKFNTEMEHDVYYSKGGKYNDSPWYYKIAKDESGKTTLVFYSNLDSYNKDVFGDFDLYEVYIINGELIMHNQSYNETIIYKKYQSISDVKNYPEGL